MTYGYQTETQDDPFLVLAEKVMAIFSQTSQPGTWLVDIIPWRASLSAKSPGYIKTVASAPCSRLGARYRLQANRCTWEQIAHGHSQSSS